MTFYLKPPEGSIPSHLFKKFAESRLKLLILLQNSKNSGMMKIDEILSQNYNELGRLDALIEGTVKDRVSYFALRSIALTDSALTDFIENGERLLFSARLQGLSGKNLEKQLVLIMKEIKVYIPYLQTLYPNSIYFKKRMRELEGVRLNLCHIIKEHLVYCTSENFLKNNQAAEIEEEHKICSRHQNSPVLFVHFTQVLSLVSQLNVRLNGGLAHLTCSQIPNYLLSIFNLVSETSRHLMLSSAVFDKISSDERLIEAQTSLKSLISSHNIYLEMDFQPSTSKISLHKELEYFPLCMSGLYKKLKETHRLCHTPRVQLTLFLKGVGVGVGETLGLIKEEYSKKIRRREGEKEHVCEHSWEQDWRRYTYGTRHLYGLEGARKNYSSHTCDSISNSSNSLCGGCPFFQTPHVTMKAINADLRAIGDIDESSIESTGKKMEDFLLSDMAPIEKCHEYLWLKINLKHKSQDLYTLNSIEKEKHGTVVISKPIHFYRGMKKLYE